jgi:hypothetical protein
LAVTGSWKAERARKFLRNPFKFFCAIWNVVENKGPKMRKMRQMRIPWNVYENKGT